MAQFDDPVMDLPQNYYDAIGEYMFRFAQLEYQLHEIVWMAIDLNYRSGRILTIGTDVRVLCGMIQTIRLAEIKWISKARTQEMNSIAGHARKQIVFRNTLAHGSWQAPKGDPKHARLHFMKEQHYRILPRYDPSLDAAKIFQKAGLLRGLNHRAKKLISLLNSERPSSQ